MSYTMPWAHPPISAAGLCLTAATRPRATSEPAICNSIAPSHQPHPNPTGTHKDTRTTHLYMIWVTYIHIHINVYIYISLSLSFYIYISLYKYIYIYVYWTWQFSTCWIASKYLESSRIEWFTYLCIYLLRINGNSTVRLWVVTIPHFKKNYYKHLEFWNYPVGGKCLPTPLIQSLC